MEWNYKNGTRRNTIPFLLRSHSTGGLSLNSIYRTETLSRGMNTLSQYILPVAFCTTSDVCFPAGTLYVMKHPYGLSFSARRVVIRTYLWKIPLRYTGIRQRELVFEENVDSCPNSACEINVDNSNRTQDGPGKKTVNLSLIIYLLIPLPRLNPPYSC